MQLKYVSLLAVVSLVAANPLHLAGYDEGHLNSLNVGHRQAGDPIIYGTVTSIKCSGRSFSCTAKVRGRRPGGRGRKHWRATWPLRSFRRGHFFDTRGQAQDFETASNISPAEMVGPLNPYSVKCDGASNPHVCKGYVGGSNVVAEWQVRVYRQPGTFGLIDGLSEDDLNLWTAHNLNLADADGKLPEMDDDMKVLGVEDDEDVDEDDMQIDEDDNPEFAETFAPVPVSRMTCSRKTRTCVANLIFGLNNYAAYWYFRAH